MIPFASHPRASASVSASQDLLRRRREDFVELGLAVAILLVVVGSLLLGLLRSLLDR